MTLYSDPNSAQSHRVRIVLGEKDLVFKVEEVLCGQNNEDLIALNPNNTTPTFVDRNLVLYESRVIMEYLDERFPHPPLMPVDPVIRAKTRMVLHYIEKDLYGLLDDVKSSGEKKSKAAKQKLKEKYWGYINDIFSTSNACAKEIYMKKNSQNHTSYRP